MIILLQQHRGSRATSQPRGRASQNMAWASHLGQADIRPSRRSSVPVRARGQRGQLRAMGGRDAGPGGRVRQRQDDDAGDPAAQAVRGRPDRDRGAGDRGGGRQGRRCHEWHQERCRTERPTPRPAPGQPHRAYACHTPRDRVPDPLPDVNHLPQGGPAARHPAHQLAWVRGATVVGRAGCHGCLCRGLPLPQNCLFSGRVAARPVAWLRLVRGRGEEVQDQGAGVGAGFLKVGVAGVGDQVESGAQDAVGE